MKYLTDSYVIGMFFGNDYPTTFWSKEKQDWIASDPRNKDIIKFPSRSEAENERDSITPLPNQSAAIFRINTSLQKV